MIEKSLNTDFDTQQKYRLKSECKIETFSGNQKLRELMTIRPVLKGML